MGGTIGRGRDGGDRIKLTFSTLIWAPARADGVRAEFSGELILEPARAAAMLADLGQALDGEQAEAEVLMVAGERFTPAEAEGLRDVLAALLPLCGGGDD